MNAVKFHIHGCLNGRTLRGDNHDLLIMVIKSRPDSPGIAHGKEVAMTHHSGHRITSIPSFACSCQDLGHINVPANLFGDILVGISL